MRTLGSKYEVLTLTRPLFWNGALGSYSASWAYSLGTGLPVLRSGPEVWLWGVTTPSGVFQSEVVVHRLAEFLLAAEIALSCLNRGMPKQKLNLLKFSAGQMA